MRGNISSHYFFLLSPYACIKLTLLACIRCITVLSKTTAFLVNLVKKLCVICLDAKIYLPALPGIYFLNWGESYCASRYFSFSIALSFAHIDWRVFPLTAFCRIYSAVNIFAEVRIIIILLLDKSLLYI